MDVVVGTSFVGEELSIDGDEMAMLRYGVLRLEKTEEELETETYNELEEDVTATLFTLLVVETDEVAVVWHGPPGQTHL